jgi:hypothetical protein
MLRHFQLKVQVTVVVLEKILLVAQPKLETKYKSKKIKFTSTSWYHMTATSCNQKYTQINTRECSNKSYILTTIGTEKRARKRTRTTGLHNISSVSLLSRGFWRMDGEKCRWQETISSETRNTKRTAGPTKQHQNNHKEEANLLRNVCIIYLTVLCNNTDDRFWISTSVRKTQMLWKIF